MDNQKNNGGKKCLQSEVPEAEIGCGNAAVVGFKVVDTLGNGTVAETGFISSSGSVTTGSTGFWHSSTFGHLASPFS